MAEQEPNAVAALLTAAGLAEDDVMRWIATSPDILGPVLNEQAARFAAERAATSRYWALGDDLLYRLPAKARRTPQEAAAAETIKEASRATRVFFMREWAR